MEKIEEKEQSETLLKDLIEKVEKDDLPTNVFDVEDTDPLVLLGKMNEIIKNLKLFAQLVSESDEQSTEALEKAVKALTQAGEALEKSIEAETLAQQGNETANKALDKAEIADSTAIEAINNATEALSKANEALEAVVQGQGTKVFDNQGNLLSNAHFTGHNGINVDMSENNPETFDMRLDNTITEAIENNHTQGQTNKAEIEATKGRVTASEEDIVELTNMLSATEELAQRATEDIRDTINPKLEELESTKLSKSYYDYNGNLVVISAESDSGFSIRTYRGKTADPNYLSGIFSIADWEGPNKLIFTVYDNNGNQVGTIRIDQNGNLTFNQKEILVKGSNAELVYDTSTSSTGAKNFLKDISQYTALAWCFYNSNHEYSIEYIPISEWNLKNSSYPLYLNTSSSGTTRYLLVVPLSNTSFQIKERSSATLRRVYGIK